MPGLTLGNIRYNILTGKHLNDLITISGALLHEFLHFVSYPVYHSVEEKLPKGNIGLA